MNARQLETFRAVMRHGTLTAAAESMNVSQPAISKVLKHFESQIGYRLFDRLGGRLVPTAEARLLIRDADRIFREIEALRIFSDRIRDKQVGLLRIAASAPATFGLLPAAAERFRRRNPDIQLELLTLPAEEISEHIVIGDIDLGLTMSNFDQPGVRTEVIGRAKVVTLLPPDSKLRHLKCITPKEIEQETLISYDSKAGIGKKMDRAFLSTGRKREPDILISLSIAAAPMVQRGLGVALVDGLVPWNRFADVVVRPFAPNVDLDIILGTSTVLPKSRFVREFTRDIRAVITSGESLD